MGLLSKKQDEIDPVIQCKEEHSCLVKRPHNHGVDCIGCLWVPVVANDIHCRSVVCRYEEPHDHGFACTPECWCK